MIINVVAIVEVDFVAQQKEIQKVVLRVMVRRTEIVEPVEQVITDLLTNVTSVHLEKPVHPAQHHLSLVKLQRRHLV